MEFHMDVWEHEEYVANTATPKRNRVTKYAASCGNIHRRQEFCVFILQLLLRNCQPQSLPTRTKHVQSKIKTKKIPLDFEWRIHLHFAQSYIHLRFCA